MYSQSDRNTSIENLFEIIKFLILKIKRKSYKPWSYRMGGERNWVTVRLNNWKKKNTITAILYILGNLEQPIHV